MVKSDTAYAASRTVVCPRWLPAHLAAVLDTEPETSIGATLVGFSD
jgi:hypothetical protein